MQNYINQLIQDLEQICKNPPARSYIESPPGFENEQEIIELAQVPFKPISEWTGIEIIAFPSVFKLSVDQCKKVTDTILKVFDAMNIDLVDLPEQIPPKELYYGLTQNWDFYIQYLPNAGFDLELCSGDPITCPYGDYCTCDEEPDFSSDISCSDNEISDSELPF